MGGKISEIGSYSELLNKKGDFAEFLIQYFSKSEDTEGNAETGELDDKIRKDLEVTIGKEALQTQIAERKMSESHDMSSSIASPKKRLNSTASSNPEGNKPTARQDSV